MLSESQIIINIEYREECSIIYFICIWILILNLLPSILECQFDLTEGVCTEATATRVSVLSADCRTCPIRWSYMWVDQTIIRWHHKSNQMEPQVCVIIKHSPSGAKMKLPLPVYDHSLGNTINMQDQAITRWHHMYVGSNSHHRLLVSAVQPDNTTKWSFDMCLHTQCRSLTRSSWSMSPITYSMLSLLSHLLQITQTKQVPNMKSCTETDFKL